jgi:hypothetical protein
MHAAAAAAAQGSTLAVDTPFLQQLTQTRNAQAAAQPFPQQLAQAGNTQQAAAQPDQVQGLPHSMLTSPPSTASTASTAAQFLQEEAPLAVRPVVPAASPMPGLTSTCAGLIPQALVVNCNGNPGIFLRARHAVQCMCLPCQALRPTQPPATWVMSPAEFERHSGSKNKKAMRR